MFSQQPTSCPIAGPICPYIMVNIPRMPYFLASSPRVRPRLRVIRAAGVAHNQLNGLQSFVEVSFVSCHFELSSCHRFLCYTTTFPSANGLKSVMQIE
jgi:hypothetical protein